MRRTVATLLVVASPVLLAVPVGAREGRIPLATLTPAAPAVAAAPPVVAAPPAVTAVAEAVAARAPAPAATPPAVQALRAKPSAATPATPVSDAAYAARLQADLCQARAIFCGLDRGGRYPAG